MMFVFALALFDAFIIQVPGMGAASKAGEKKGYWGSFLMGMFAVLIATPCTAPILGAALGFAFQQQPSVIFAIFISVGIGLGFPFLLISAFPKMIKLLPKPGEWMNIFKEALGFLLLGFCIKMLSVIEVQMGGAFVVNHVLMYALVLRIAVWFYGRFVTPMHTKLVQWVMAGVAVVLIIVGVRVFLSDLTPPEFDFSSNVASRDGFWLKFDEQVVYEAIEFERAVFIDFTAEYCLVCKQNEALVLNTADIRGAFTEKDVLMLKGDFTRRSPVIHEWLRRYNKAGVPLYLLFIPGVEEPVVFPEILTKPMIFEALDRIP
jgi:thiol:disulfide interchange protein DsbD